MKNMKTHPLKKLREACHLTQQAVADDLGMSQVAIANIENYQRFPSFQTFLEIYLYTKKKISMELNVLDFCSPEYLKKIEKRHQM